MHTEFERVLDESWRAVEARVDAISGGCISRPPAIPKDVPTRTARVGEDFPVLRHLPGAVEAASAGELADLAGAFAAMVGSIEWSQNSGYTAENSTQSFLDGYAYASFSGAAACVRSPALCTEQRCARASRSSRRSRTVVRPATCRWVRMGITRITGMNRGRSISS